MGKTAIVVVVLVVLGALLGFFLLPQVKSPPREIASGLSKQAMTLMLSCGFGVQETMAKPTALKSQGWLATSWKSLIQEAKRLSQ
jgi:hypothetical protein